MLESMAMSMYGDAGVHDTDEDVEGDGEETSAVAGDPDELVVVVVAAELHDGRRTSSGTMSSRSPPPPPPCAMIRSSPTTNPTSYRYELQFGTACSSKKPALLPPLSPLLSPGTAGTTTPSSGMDGGGEVVVVGWAVWRCSFGFLADAAAVAEEAGVGC
jgi:hypothetical protein